MYDLLIKNGLVFDGSLAEPQNLDLAIKNKKIVALGKLKNEKAKIEINAEKRFVSPGFIDLNSDVDHDLSLLEAHEAENLIRQGITTVVGGNCGASLAPLISGSLVSLSKWAKSLNVNVGWRTVAEFFNFLEKKSLPLNFATLIGWGTLRNEITKDEFRSLSSEELAALKTLVNQSLKEGAFGVSFGLGYDSEQAVGISEILEIAQLVKQLNGYLSFHLRNESSGFLASVREVLEVAEKGLISLEISHFKVEGQENFPDFSKALKMIRELNEKEKNGSSDLINFDLFPYDFNIKAASLLLPDWATVEGREVFLKNIHDPVVCQKLKDDLKKKKCLTPDLVIADSGSRWWFAGKTLGEISQNFSLPLEDAFLKLLELCENKVLILTKSLSQENIDQAFLSSYSFVGSDSGIYNLDSAKKGIWVHPRSFGTFPRFLSEYVKEKKLLSWPLALNKITGKAAEKIGFKNRGYLRENYCADVVIFNPEKLKDTATLENPFQYPEGIETVIVNGGIAYQKGLFSRDQYGQIIRKNQN